MFEVRSLRKEYGALVAVDDVSFKVEPGSIFGLLGPNGAGKSTTIGCISGLLSPTSGHVHILGHDIAAAPLEAKRALGVVPQELALYEDLSATENLSYWASAYGMSRSEQKSRIGDLLESIGLLDRAGDKVETMSGGMKRRLNLACGVVHKPRVLLLDEPTVGVDPQSRVRLLELIREYAKDGTAVLYTTHYMEEAQELCDDLAIIDHGKLIATGTLADLRAMMSERDLLRLAGTFGSIDMRSKLAAVTGVEVVSTEADHVTLAVAEASRKLPAIFAVIAEAGGTIQETTLTQPSLETLFIKLTGRELQE